MDNSTKLYDKTYVYGLNQQIRMLKKALKSHKQLSLLQKKKIKMLNIENTHLLKLIKKVKRWYQIIIW